jgi:hypothetical protein
MAREREREREREQVEGVLERMKDSFNRVFILTLLGFALHRSNKTRLELASMLSPAKQIVGTVLLLLVSSHVSRAFVVRNNTDMSRYLDHILTEPARFGTSAFLWCITDMMHDFMERPGLSVISMEGYYSLLGDGPLEELQLLLNRSPAAYRNPDVSSIHIELRRPILFSSFPLVQEEWREFVSSVVYMALIRTAQSMPDEPDHDVYLRVQTKMFSDPRFARWNRECLGRVEANGIPSYALDDRVDKSVVSVCQPFFYDREDCQDQHSRSTLPCDPVKRVCRYNQRRRLTCWCP